VKILDMVELFGLPWQIFADDPADPYMLRVHLTPDRAWWRKRLPGVALNYFFRGDRDLDYHNHGWRWSCSIVLTNGYLEFRKDGRYALVREILRLPGTLNLIWHDTFHRVELNDPRRGALTLFIMAPRPTEDGEDSQWGFTPEDGATFEHWRERRARLGRDRTA
jgi:hypothetical protein